MATIVTRAGKGSPLTHTEMDANLDNMNDQKIELTSETGSCVFPNGTTAQRDGTPQSGYTRFNTTTGVLELYDGSNWINFVEQTSTTGSCVFPSGTTAQRDSIPSAGYSRWNTSTESVEVFDGTNWVGFGGASAINELNDATVSASDPTITTNPNAVGQLWVNKTSGECYVCTDNTTDENIWTNIGGGSGNVSPNDPPVITGLTVSPSLPSSLSSDTTTLFTWSGATDPDGNDANIVYSATAISDSNLTIAAPSGGTQGQLNLTVAAISGDVSNVSFKIRVTDEYGNVVDSSTYTINLLANQAPVITGLTVDTTAIASYSWSDVNTGSTNDYTIAGATDPDGTDSAIVYSIVNISNANLTATGGVAGADNVTLTVATIGSDISGVTFNVRATDEDGGTNDSEQQTINLNAISYPVLDTANTTVTATTDPADSNYRILTFTGDGAFKFSSAGTENQLDYLIIAGGGGGDTYPSSSAGGAGGYKTSYASETSGGSCGNQSTIDMAGSTIYTVNIGAGGQGNTSEDTAYQGENSTISGSGLTTITAIGGGSGGGGAGGSGGGSLDSPGGSAIGCGYNGGVNRGGGGGAGGVGYSNYGSGGAGLTSYIGNTSGVCRAGGGSRSASSQCGGGQRASAGSANTGGGGGGFGYNGGSGLVIVRYQVS